MGKKIIAGTVSTIVIAILIIITIKLTSISDNSLSFSDLDTVADNLIASGITYKELEKDDPLIKNRKIIITQSVNENLAHEVINKLLYLDSISHDSIYVIIFTHGGWGNSAKAIIETFNLITSPVNTIAVGTCYSSGMLISVSATGKRYATKNTIFMLHANLDDDKEDKNMEKYYNGWYEDLFRDNCKLPPEWFPMTNDEEYYLNTSDAIKYRVIDEVIEKIK